MGNIYDDVLLVKDQFDLKDLEEMMYEMSDTTLALRNAARKKHFGSNTNSDIRTLAIKTAAIGMAIAEATIIKCDKCGKEMKSGFVTDNPSMHCISPCTTDIQISGWICECGNTYIEPAVMKSVMESMWV